MLFGEHAKMDSPVDKQSPDGTASQVSIIPFPVGLSRVTKPKNPCKSGIFTALLQILSEW
jgi:hypothetical protein